MALLGVDGDRVEHHLNTGEAGEAFGETGAAAERTYEHPVDGRLDDPGTGSLVHPLFLAAIRPGRLGPAFDHRDPRQASAILMRNLGCRDRLSADPKHAAAASDHLLASWWVRIASMRCAGTPRCCARRAACWERSCLAIGVALARWSMCRQHHCHGVDPHSEVTQNRSEYFGNRGSKHSELSACNSGLAEEQQGRSKQCPGSASPA